MEVVGIVFPYSKIDQTDVEIQFEAVGTLAKFETAGWSTASDWRLSPNPRLRRLHLTGLDTPEANSPNYLNVLSYISPFDSKILPSNRYQLNSRLL